ncbi:MAG: hypothetical protein DI588_09135 [Flavobacterium johnsoniae]|nr:MAG: hypothetical protein DI588_09135 [Flavobacterium johnsoniae]
MNKRFDIQANQILSVIVDKIESTLKCPKFQEYSGLIEIDTWENIKLKMPHNRNIAEMGFGFCISNFCELGNFKRIVIINMENCNQLNLTEDEISAIILHELGHLLNDPEPTQVPTYMHCLTHEITYDKHLEEDIRINNMMQKEIFADSYANHNGYGIELIASFNKYNEHFDNKIGFHDIRVKKIESKELFEGNVKQIDRNN